MRPFVRRALWIAFAALVVFLAARAFRPMPILVDVAAVERGTLRVTADDDGRTRVRERYMVSAPVDGRLLRTVLDPGDAVVANETLIAEFAPVLPHLLDARSRAEAEARLGRAEAALEQADARRAEAEAELTFAKAELERARNLVSGGIGTREALERAERDERRATSALRAAELAVQVARYELELAGASLVGPAAPAESEPRAGGNGEPLEADGRLLLRSPIDGVVLRVFEESARTLLAGTPILEVGTTSALEIVADYLSQDAVKIEPGMPALVTGWGGEAAPGEEHVLRGVVRVVEPGGFTKVSALGVEEQRVNVIVDPLGDLDEWAALGDGYRVELRIVLWEADGVSIVPTGALFREGDRWAVFVVEDGETHPRVVELGHRSGLAAEVLAGLAEGERVVLYPSELVGAGTRVDVR